MTRLSGANSFGSSISGLSIRNRTWMRAGKELGLTVTTSLTGSPSMRGTIDGISIIVDMHTHGSERRTRCLVAHKPVGPRAKLQLDTRLRQAARRFGIGSDVTIGDPLFDEKVRITTDSPDELSAFLSPARQAALLDLFVRYRNCIINNHEITVFLSGSWFTGWFAIVDAVKVLVDVAKVMEAPASLNAALQQQHAGDLAEATTELHKLNESSTNSFTTRLEAENLVELGERDQAAALYDAMQKKPPRVPSHDGWSNLAHTPPPPAPSPPAAQSSTQSQQEVIDELFDGALPSYLAVDQFDANYANTHVTWQGELERFHSYKTDLDFGNTPGTKAVVLLGSSGRSQLISNEVRAVLQLPDDIALRHGTNIRFTGQLLHIDRFSRMIYVANARVI